MTSFTVFSKGRLPSVGCRHSCHQANTDTRLENSVVEMRERAGLNDSKLTTGKGLRPCLQSRRKWLLTVPNRGRNRRNIEKHTLNVLENANEISHGTRRRGHDFGYPDEWSAGQQHPVEGQSRQRKPDAGVKLDGTGAGVVWVVWVMETVKGGESEAMIGKCLLLTPAAVGKPGHIGQKCLS